MFATVCRRAYASGMTGTPRELVLLGRAEKALAEAKTVDELQDLRDRAQACRAYAKKAKLGHRIVVEASALKVRAERKLGELLAEMPLAKGGSGNQHTKGFVNRSQHVNSSSGVTLESLGVTRWDSARSQQIARLPKREFEKYVTESVAAEREPSTAAVLRLAKQHTAVVRANGKPKRSGFVTSLRSLVRRDAAFGTIYADPPWPYRNRTSRGAAENHYPVMTMEDILAEPVAKIAAENAHLHLWVPSSFLREGLDVMDAWGFTYKSQFVWVKPTIGAGNYWRVSHELLLFGSRGMTEDHELLLFGKRGGEPFHDNAVRSWAEYPREAHSKKPEEVRKLVEQVSPGPYLEMYGREKRKGWTVYGNQVQ